MSGFLDLLDPVSAGAKVGRKVAEKALPPINDVIQSIRRPEFVRQARTEIAQQLITPPDIAQRLYQPSEAFTPPLQSTFRGLSAVATGGALPAYDVFKGL